MATTEFDEIRPYNDEELPQIFEELIADPAFQKQQLMQYRMSLLNFWRRRYALAKANWIFRKHSVMVFCGK